MKKILALLFFTLSVTASEVITDSVVLKPATLPTAAKSGALRINGSGALKKYYSGVWTDVGLGDVVGPASSTDNAVTRFNSTTGKLLQNSTVTINDDGDISTISSLQTSSGALYVGRTESQPTNPRRGIQVDFNPTSNSSQSNEITGILSSFILNGTGAHSSSNTAIKANANVTGSGNHTTLIGVSGRASNAGTGTMSNAYSIRALPPTNIGGGILTNAYGLYVDSVTGVGATLNRSLHVNGGESYLGGNLLLKSLSSSDTITIATPAIASSYTLTLPVDDGTSGQVLSTNGSGVTSWIAAGGGSSPLTTKGDIFTYDTASARLPVGTDGQILKANSATATGLEWGSISGTGDVVGPASSTNLAIARFDSTTGKLLKNSSTYVGDNGEILATINTITDPSTAVTSLGAVGSFNLTAPNSQDLTGGILAANLSGTGSSTGTIYGSVSQVTNSGTGSMSNLTGSLVTVSTDHISGTLDNMFGGRFETIMQTGGNTINAYSGYFISPTIIPPATATNAYGVYILGGSTAATNTYSLYVDGGKTKLDGASDVVQLTVEGHSTQTANILDVQKSDATKLLQVTNVNGTKIKGTTTSDSAAAGIVGEDFTVLSGGSFAVGATGY